MLNSSGNLKTDKADADFFCIRLHLEYNILDVLSSF